MAAIIKVSDQEPRAIVMPMCLCVAMLACAQTLALGAPLTFQQLAQRLPAASNAVVAINVTKVLASPYAKREHWGTITADAWAKQPVMIPPGAARLIMAASVKPSSMDSYWEMSLIEMDKMPSIKEIADAEGGHIDRLWDKDGAYSPINAYFLPIEPTILASITPAERVEISRWVRQPVKPEGIVTSAYIKSVVAGLSDRTDIVMAMDLEGAYGLPGIRKFLDDNEIKEIPEARTSATAQVLESVQGITLEINVGENITGRATVQFERDAGLLADSAKPVMLAALKRAGMGTADVQNWKFAVAGKKVSMEGNMSAAGLRELLGMVQSPIPAVTVAAPAAATPRSGSTPPANPAEASQRYFRAVDMCVKSLREGTSAAATATAIRNATKRIEQLPILQVDPALVEWGGVVTTTLKQAASVLSVGQAQINSRVAGIQDPDYVAYSYDRSDGANAAASTAMRNASKQRQQAAQEQKAASFEQALTIINGLAGTTPKIRAEMVAKYNVEF